MVKLTFWLLGLLELVCGRTMENCGVWAGKALSMSEMSLMDHFGGSLEDNNVERKADSGGPTYEVSEGNKDPVRNWARGHSCDILAKNLASFCLCLENRRKL